MKYADDRWLFMHTLGKTVLSTLFGLLLVTAPVTLGQALITGRTTVIDGDTLDMDGLRIRLYGVDAPEFEQTCTLNTGATWACGIEAREALAEKLDNQNISCEQKDVDRYRRSVAVCRLNDVDINAWLVASGWAVAYREFSSDYIDAEAAASSARLNIWRGNFKSPAEFRREQDSNTGTDSTNRRACTIKGNISASGELIYHMPGGEFYERTVISTARGERLFCTEKDAQDAGWRRSRR